MISNPDTQKQLQKPPQNFNCSLLRELLFHIDRKDLFKFKSLLSSSSSLITKEMLNSLLVSCINSYKTKNIFVLRFITELFSYGADPNINIIENSPNKSEPNVIKTLLMIAVELSDLILLNNLITNNCDVNFKDNKNRNCLFYLKGGDNDNEIIKLLINKGININDKDEKGNTPLHFAIENNRENVASCLIETGNCDYLAENLKGVSSIEVAFETWNGKNELKKFLDCIKRKLSIEERNMMKEVSNKDNKQNDNVKLKEQDLIEELKEKNIMLKLTPTPMLVLSQVQKEKNKEKINQIINKQNNINLNSNLYIKKLQEINQKVINNNMNEKFHIQQLKEYLALKQKLYNKLIQEYNNESANYQRQMNSLMLEYKKIVSSNNNLRTQITNSENFNTITPNVSYAKKFSSTEFYKKTYIIQQLQKDLVDFRQYVTNKINQMQPVLDKLIQLMQSLVVQSLGNEYKIKVYGSHATKLCLPWSDIDIVVSPPDFQSYTPLFTLYQYIFNQNIFKQVNYIGKTQVPLIKIYTDNNFYNISLDISLENPKHYGVQCVQYVSDLLKKYECMAPMALAVKNLLQLADLNDPYKGGLSSYGAILLILNFLELEASKGNDISLMSLGNIFYEFLQYYSNTFDPSKGIINVLNRNDIDVLSQYHLQMINGELVIVDPLNLKNNVGKNTRQFNNIRLAFMIAYITAKETCECGCHFQCNIRVNEECVEHCLLKRIFNSVKRVKNED